MQIAFDFGAVGEVNWIRDQLNAAFGSIHLVNTREPIGQLVKSLISGRTRDAISLAAYERLIHRYMIWADLAMAAVDDVLDVIADVTFPEVKTRHLGETLRAIAVSHPNFDLNFLAGLSVPQALEWLETFPGVGRKVSASTLNFSTLNLPAFVVDTHILRILGRFGFVETKAETSTAYDAVMEATVGWSAEDLTELHVLLKRLGQNICRADQACCQICPIRQHCAGVI